MFCPYQSDTEWRRLKLFAPEDFDKAVEVDETIRHKRPGYVAYVCRHRQPLNEVDLRNEQDHSQLALWGEECDSLCGL